ncbi:hypothetical protein RJ43_12015 [Alteromonas macleodii]|uniref:AraC family transcriptional regulator n=1 Tax=Alteromonas macleodii TaxID=28108 RepID=UPI00057F0524|nr:AraC family transcriptional regulator [Alteromonas macleodii]KHT51404.1 hypothetical protein RJ43_12015 [Alteromonas macleodii]
MDRKAQFSLWIRLSRVLQALLESHDPSLISYLKDGRNVIIDKENWLSQTSLSWGEILTLAIRKTGTPSLALQFGQHLSLSSIGPLGYVIASCPNVSEAAKILVKYWSIISDEVELSLERRLNETALVITTNISEEISKVSFIETILSGIVSIGQLVTNKRFSGLTLRLDYVKPKHYKNYEEYLGTINHFSSDRCELVIPNSLLKKSIDSSNPYIRPLLKYQCELISSCFFSSYKLTNEICWLLVECNHLNMPLNHAAKKLNLSERSLRRKLKYEKTTYSEIRDKIKQSLALDYLRNSDFTIEDISILLGFSEKSSFKRAFKRWYDLPPSSMRQSTHKLDRLRIPPKSFDAIKFG